MLFSFGTDSPDHSGVAGPRRYNNFTAADVLAHRVRFWRQCVGLVPEPPLRLKGPAVLFVNRRHAGEEACAPLQNASELPMCGNHRLSLHQQLS